MTVSVALSLDCGGQGCTTRFVPLVPIATAITLRALAAKVGWTFNKRFHLDLCPVCGPHHVPAARMPRGICDGCGEDRALTLRGAVVQHIRPNSRANKWGRKPACRGGGQMPRRAQIEPRELRDGPYPGWHASA